MTLDFTNTPVFDNHCHPLDEKKTFMDPETLAKEFYHGIGDIPVEGIRGRYWGVTEELRQHFPYMGVVNTMVRQLSKLFGCPSTLKAVAQERNRLTSKGFAAYAKRLAYGILSRQKLPRAKFRKNNYRHLVPFIGI